MTAAAYKAESAALPAAAGTYVLVMQSRKAARIKIGRLGTLDLQPGFYLYVGSAQGSGGIAARVNRHRRRNKKLHWHIDYLRRHTTLVETWFRTGPSCEHEWAAMLSEHYDCARIRFGASDCRCPAHLFFSAQQPTLEIFAENLQIFR